MEQKFLIADDDPVVRLILTAILESLGHSSDAVESGSACIEEVTKRISTQSPPRIIFLDHLLQDMSGLDVLAELRRLTASAPIPVIMLSSNSKEEILELSPQVTPDYFLEKPFRSETVAAAIAEVLKTESC